MRRRRVALHWMPVIGVVAAMALLMLPALGRDLDGRYRDSALHDWFEHLASGPVLFVCRRLCCHGCRLGDQGQSLSRARAEGGRLQRDGLGRCAG
jgi:hypothetical protein